VVESVCFGKRSAGSSAILAAASGATAENILSITDNDENVIYTI
jgi:hypothetical protein